MDQVLDKMYLQVKLEKRREVRNRKYSSTSRGQLTKTFQCFTCTPVSGRELNRDSLANRTLAHSALQSNKTNFTCPCLKSKWSTGMKLGFMEGILLVCPETYVKYVMKIGRKYSSTTRSLLTKTFQCSTCSPVSGRKLYQDSLVNITLDNFAFQPNKKSFTFPCRSAKHSQWLTRLKSSFMDATLLVCPETYVIRSAENIPAQPKIFKKNEEIHLCKYFD